MTGFIEGESLQKSILTILTLLLCSSFHARAERYIVKYKQNATFMSAARELHQQNDLFDRLGLSPLRQGVNFLSEKAEVTQAFLNLEMVVIEAELSEQEVKDIADNPAVDFIQKETFIQVPRNFPTLQTKSATPKETALPLPKLPWGVLSVKAPEAWELAGRGEGIRVMVLDTGIDQDHPALKDNFEKGEDFVREGVETPYPFYDHIGHGTHTSGVIVANELSTGMMGVAPKAKLLMGRVCGIFYECPTTAILAGVDWAISEQVDVLNISLGSPFPTPDAQQAYARAAEAGIVVVSATGNHHVGSVAYPAAYPSVLSVGAVKKDLTHPDFSNWGDELDVVAPGVEIYSSVPAGKGNTTEVIVDLGNGIEKVKSSGFAGSKVSDQKVHADFVYAGVGRSEDFTPVDVRGKIVLLQRGLISFGDKAKNAAAAGAAAVVIFNNEEGLLWDSTLNGEVPIPVVMIEKTVGEQLLEQFNQSLNRPISVGNLPSSYMALDGTSMAAPHVAGIAVLIRAVNPNLTALEVQELIKKTATPIASEDENYFGSGMVNAEAAVQEALALSVPVNPAP